MASDIKKPDGLFVIKPADAQIFIDGLTVERFYGIGKVTAVKMHKLGIHNGFDLRQWDVESLFRNFGRAGEFFFDIARGIDERPVEPDQERKSVGTEITYAKDLKTRFEIIAELYKLEKELMERLENAQTTGRTITVKVKFSDFRQITRSRTLHTYINDFDTLHREVTSIRKAMDLEGERIRLMGVTVSNLITEDNADRQMHLFDKL
jgi:DNA polymerase-4